MAIWCISFCRYCKRLTAPRWWIEYKCKLRFSNFLSMKCGYINTTLSRKWIGWKKEKLPSSKSSYIHSRWRLIDPLLFYVIKCSIFTAHILCRVYYQPFNGNLDQIKHSIFVLMKIHWFFLKELGIIFKNCEVMADE